MSSDPFADLASSLDRFADALRDLLDSKERPAPGSPAAAEIEAESLAGEWGDHPSGTVFSIVLLTTASCADYLAGAASVISGRRASFSPYVLVRAAAESASIGCYLADPTIDARERVRRSINIRLDGMCERLTMLRGITAFDVASEIGEAEERIAAFGRAGAALAFTFRDASGPGRSAWLDPKLPSAMQLMDAATSDTTGLGVAYQRLLSAVTHGKMHGLTRFLMTDDSADASGAPRVQINVPARTLALELLAGPLCGFNFLRRLARYTGWETDDLSRPVALMLATWGRIAHVPTPTPLIA